MRPSLLALKIALCGVLPLSLVALSAPVHAQATANPIAPVAPAAIEAKSAGTYAVGTFECLGLCHTSPDLGECRVRFRAQGAAQWREGLPLWYDARTTQYRGSLVYLQPGTAHDVELMLGGKTVAVPGARTRSDKFPIGKTTVLKGGETYDPIKITESGTPNAYHLVTIPPGEHVSIDVANQADNTVTIGADYVIVRGLELKNAATHGVYIAPHRHDIVVEDCHILG